MYQENLSERLNITSDADRKLQVQGETITYGCYSQSPVTIDEKDFFLNSVGLIHELAIKEYRGNEGSKTVNRDDARNVRIKVGGGGLGDRPMPRSRMVQILVEFVDALTRDYGFHPIECDAFIGTGVRGRPVAHYQVSIAANSKELMILSV